QQNISQLPTQSPTPFAHSPSNSSSGFVFAAAARTRFTQGDAAMATTHKSHSHDTPNSLDTDDRKHMKDSTYAFPKQRKEPLNDASHVRNAIARFDQVKDVSDSEREEAFHHIKTAAKKFGV